MVFTHAFWLCKKLLRGETEKKLKIFNTQVVEICALIQFFTMKSGYTEPDIFDSVEKCRSDIMLNKMLVWHCSKRKKYECITWWIVWQIFTRAKFWVITNNLSYGQYFLSAQLYKLRKPEQSKSTLITITVAYNQNGGTLYDAYEFWFCWYGVFVGNCCNWIHLCHVNGGIIQRKSK